MQPLVLCPGRDVPLHPSCYATGIDAFPNAYIFWFMQILHLNLLENVFLHYLGLLSLNFDLELLELIVFLSVLLGRKYLLLKYIVRLSSMIHELFNKFNWFLLKTCLHNIIPNLSNRFYLQQFWHLESRVLTSFLMIWLFISAKSEVVLTPQNSNMDVKLGEESVTLSVSISSNSNYSLEWFKNGVIIPQEDPHFKQEWESEFLINF